MNSRVIRLSTLDQPPHRRHDIRVRRHPVWVLLVVRQRDAVFLSEPIALHHKLLYVLDIIDASSELGRLIEIVDANEQGTLTALAIRELEVADGRGVAFRALDGPALGWWSHILGRHLLAFCEEWCEW